MNKIWLKIVLVATILGIIGSTGWGFLRNLGVNVASPGQLVLDAFLNIRAFFDALDEVNSLRAKIQTLEAENSNLLSENIRLIEKIKKQDEANINLDLAKRFDFEKIISAEVVARSPLKILDGIMINKGTKNGIASGDPVLANGFLVGQVAEVFPNKARVILITNPRFITPVILGKSRAQGILRGGIDGLVVEDLPRDKTIQDAEPVLTSAIGQLPSNLPIGTVKKVISEEQEILQRVLIATPVKINSLEQVVVGKSLLSP